MSLKTMFQPDVAVEGIVEGDVPTIRPFRANCFTVLQSEPSGELMEYVLRVRQSSEPVVVARQDDEVLVEKKDIDRLVDALTAVSLKNIEIVGKEAFNYGSKRGFWKGFLAASFVGVVIAIIGIVVR